MPSKDFKRWSFEERRKDTYTQCDNNSDPALATSNFFTRDFILAEKTREEAQADQLRLLKIDGSLSPDEVMTTIESHFALYLPKN